MPVEAPLTEAIDGLAITMVLLIGFSLGMILTILIVMARNSGKNPDVLPEDDDEKRPPQPQSHRPKKEESPSWERDGDWWKDEDG